jgi:hypothetical protein
MSEFPFEIKAQVFSYLDEKDVLALRLATKAWVVAGTSSIFKNGLTL